MSDETRLAQRQSMDNFIQRASKDPTFDVPKFKELLAMQREQQDRDARSEFAAALADAISDMPKVFRNKSNEGKKYADLEQINDIIVPILSRHGLVVSFSEDPERTTPTSIGIKAYIIHRNGHQEVRYGSAEPDGTGLKGSANKTAIQARGSALSYGRRYMLLQMFNITVSNEDNDGAPLGRALETITDSQLNDLEALLTKSGIDRTKFLIHFNLAALHEMTQKQYPTAIGMVNHRIAENEKKGKP